MSVYIEMNYIISGFGSLPVIYYVPSSYLPLICPPVLICLPQDIQLNPCPPILELTYSKLILHRFGLL